MRKVYGYSCREIAEHLGRSTNTVRDQVAQSFRKLREIQAGGGPGPGEFRCRAKVGPVQPEASEVNERYPFGLAPLANRESSG